MRFSGRPAGAGVDYLFFGVYRRKNCDPGFHGTEYSKGRCEEYKMKKKRFGVIGIALAILFLLGAAPSVLAAGLPSVAIPVKVEVEGAAPSVPEELWFKWRRRILPIQCRREVWMESLKW